MKDSDKDLLKASAAVVADQAVAAAGSAISGADKNALSVVGLGTAWGLTKAIFGNALKLREKRAIEWVELIRDNPEVFAEEVLATETFQDGFVYCVEQYLAERNEEKRQYIKNVFLGYVAAGDHEEFPLERLLMTSQQLSNIDVATLKNVDASRQDKITKYTAAQIRTKIIYTTSLILDYLCNSTTTVSRKDIQHRLYG